MSYATMNHAEWVERNNAACNKAHGHRRGYVPKPERLTEFQAKVMDILGMVFGGIYNAPISWGTVEWQYGKGISLVSPHGNGLATFDFAHLTTLVFLCHEARIRAEIDPAGPRGFRFSLWPRSHTGSMGQRHPNLDEAVAKFREYLPADHRIVYREDTGQAAPPRAAE